MKKILKLSALVLLVALSIESNAQKSDVYVTSGGEWIFSWGSTDNDGPVRFSPVVNFQFNLNKDISDNFGVYSGLAIRNVGFIWDDPNQTDVRYKFRTYNLGIPFGIKLGNLDGLMLSAGYELEVPIHYKQKRFENEQKTKFTVFFSDRVTKLQHAVFAGIQLYSGTTIKFKYYLKNFHNQSYTETDGTQPYADLTSNVFYISLNFDLFRNTDFYYKEVDRNVSTARL